MPDSHSIEYAAQTDIGQKRTHNEDAIVVCPEIALAVLADGMGGYSAGEVASEIATAMIRNYLYETVQPLLTDSENYQVDNVDRAVFDSIQLANTAVFEAALAEPRYAGMGTTLVMTVCHGNTLLVAHVGDSRAYRFRQGQLVQITRDHSVVQEQVDAGTMTAEAAFSSELKNLVTRAIGVTYAVLPDITRHEIAAGDIFLLCSDGLSDMLTADVIQNTLQKNTMGLQDMCSELINLANSAGGYDNISVILFKT